MRLLKMEHIITEASVGKPSKGNIIKYPSKAEKDWKRTMDRLVSDVVKRLSPKMIQKLEEWFPLIEEDYQHKRRFDGPTTRLNITKAVFSQKRISLTVAKLEIRRRKRLKCHVL